VKHPLARFALIALLPLAILLLAYWYTQSSGRSSTPAQLLDNGSFESPKAAKEYDTFTANSRLGPWTVGGGPVDLVARYWKPRRRRPIPQPPRRRGPPLDLANRQNHPRPNVHPPLRPLR
jgi:hypothetical protein